jgi:hypothetical protein
MGPRHFHVVPSAHSGEVMSIPSAEVFFETIRLLRTMPRRWQSYASHAAEFWSDERLQKAEINGDVPGQNGALTPEGTSVQ